MKSLSARAREEQDDEAGLRELSERINSLAPLLRRYWPRGDGDGAEVIAMIREAARG